MFVREIFALRRKNYGFIRDTFFYLQKWAKWAFVLSPTFALSAKSYIYMYSETDTRTQQIGYYCLHPLNTEISFQANWKLSKHFFLGRQNKI